LMLPRITSVRMYMHVCPMCACEFGSTGVDIRCPRAHGNSQSTTARGKWESPKKNASTRSGTKRLLSLVSQRSWCEFNIEVQEQPLSRE